MKSSPLPRYLIQRYKSWHNDVYAESAAWYARLAQEGQRPRAMVISCCDSRIDTVQMFGAEPGDLFVVRNVANLVPPFTPDPFQHGTSAAIEYAVTALKVAHIVVLGHYNCGGVAACLDMCCGKAPHLEERTSFVGRWMDVLRPTAEKIAKLDLDDREKQTLLEQENPLLSLRNLMTFPFVETAVDEGVLTLHAAWVDLRDGSLHVHDQEKQEFVAV